MKTMLCIRGKTRISVRRLLEVFVCLCCFLQITVFLRHKETLPAESDNKYFIGKSEEKLYINVTKQKAKTMKPLVAREPVENPVHYSMLPADYWQYVTKENTKVKTLVFSAYYHNATKPAVIRLIAVGPSGRKFLYQGSMRCLLYRPGGNITVVRNVQVKNIKEGWGLKYSAQFVDCPLNGPEIPHMVSLIPSKDETAPRNKIQVQVAPKSSPLVGDFVTCVKPLHYHYNRALWLVEFIEFYRILGVQHFVFYNDSVGPDIQTVLEYYIKEGVASVFPWLLPMKTQKEVRTENMFAALNDCVYRSRHRYKYAVMVDLDEFIVPENQYNYTQLMRFLLRNDNGKTPAYGSFIFRNVFHYLYWDNDTTALQRLKPYETPGDGGPYLLTQLKTKRLKEPHKVFKRSKYFVRPELAVESGNHNVWTHVGDARSMSVSASVGLSHHYRICEFGGYDCLKSSSVIDKTMHRYSDQLIPQIFSECNKIFGKAGCPKAPPLGSPY